MSPLRAAIAQGVRRGEFTADRAQQAAVMVAAVVFDAAGLTHANPSAGLRASKRDVESVMTFWFRALGALLPSK